MSDKRYSVLDDDGDEIINLYPYDHGVVEFAPLRADPHFNMSISQVLDLASILDEIVLDYYRNRDE